MKNNYQPDKTTISEIYLHQDLLAIKTDHYVGVTRNIRLIGQDEPEENFTFDFSRYWGGEGQSLQEIMQDIWRMCLSHLEVNPDAVVCVGGGKQMHVFSFGDLPKLRTGAMN